MRQSSPLRSTRRSLTPSSWHTLLTGNSFGMRTDVYTLEATGTYNDDEINRLAREGKQRGHIPGVGRVLPARATASPSTPAHESTLNSLHKKVDFTMSLFKSDSKYSYMFSQFESGGASGSGGCEDDEDKDGDGDLVVLYMGIPCERSPANIPRRQVAGKKYPQRQVAGESPELLLGNGLNVVVTREGVFVGYEDIRRCDIKLRAIHFFWWVIVEYAYERHDESPDNEITIERL
nr:hypothetical protein [Tanacetum cinerariifolium]